MVLAPEVPSEPKSESSSDGKPEQKATPVIPKENGRPKTTTNIFNRQKAEEKVEEIKPVSTIPDKPLALDELKLAWLEFAELRKNQIAEYQLLKNDFTLTGSVVCIQLSNPIEEPLLQSIRTSLTTHLRHKLANQTITIAGIVKENDQKKVAYTDKEKFDLLAEKNPVLRQLKERFGLDSDF
jgi:hypothetical protein